MRSVSKISLTPKHSSVLIGRKWKLIYTEPKGKGIYSEVWMLAWNTSKKITYIKFKGDLNPRCFSFHIPTKEDGPQLLIPFSYVRKGGKIFVMAGRKTVRLAGWIDRIINHPK